MVYAVHEFHLARHDGLNGQRDQNAVESTTSPGLPRCDGTPISDAAQLGAAFGFAGDHGLSDGSKRTAMVAARVFLADNGLSLQFSPIGAIRAMKAVAGGSMEVALLAHWFRQRMDQSSARSFPPASPSASTH